MKEQESKSLVELVIGITYSTIVKFIMFSRKCKVKDEITERKLIEMIATAFSELDQEGEND